MMPSYPSPRDLDMARRVRRLLIEQSCILQEESPDEFTWLTRHYSTEEHFFNDEMGAQLELRLGRWARAYWPTPPRNRELCLTDVFELTTRKQTAYACLVRAYRSVRLLEGGENASTFRFAELYRYIADEGSRQSPWLSFDETVIAAALAAGPEDEEEPEDDEAPTTPKPRKGRPKAETTATRSTVTARTAAGAAQRARMNQRALYQAFQSFERMKLLRRIGSDERQRPEEQFKYDERDYGGLYEFTDIIDRFLPPAALVRYDDEAVLAAE